jgi:4-hydroxy-tetrahydrodipicolinate synthase
MKYVPRGMIAALPTPFNSDESINFAAYKKLIDHLVENKMHCLLAAGSTGEYRTMTMEERKSVIKAACEYAAGRIPVIAGTGMYTARETIELTNYAAGCGADCGLVLPPYYQKTSRQGIIDFFKEIAAGSEIGIVIYNYPSATGVDLDPEMILELAQVDNIVCLKDTTDMMHTAECIALTKDIKDFSVLNGMELCMIPTLALGGGGTMGIAHNIVPKEIVQIYDLIVEENDVKAATAVYNTLTNLFKYMELEPYPGPVKAAMDYLGLEGGVVRKPLVQTSDALKEKLIRELKKLGY